MTLDNHQRRIFRLAFGVTLSSAIAVGFAWPLSYMAPMLVINILGASDDALSPKKSFAMLFIITVGLFSGVIFSSLFITQPLLSSILLTVIFYWIYYYSNVGTLPKVAGIILLVAMTVIPMMSQYDPSLASSFALSFLYTAFLAIAFCQLSYLAFPHQHDQPTLQETATAELNSPAEARRIAGISTLIVVPAVIYFLTFNLLQSSLIIIFIAILSLNPVLEQGKKAGIGLMLGNALGGLITIIFYNVMKTAPHYIFYIVLIAGVSLFMAQRIYSEKKAAPLWNMALVTLLVLTGATFTAAGDADAQDKFSTRIIYITMAAAYIIIAFTITAQLWRKEERKDQEEKHTTDAG